MNNTKKYGKDFTLVVVGQIVSLFGNAILRFSLPLYLLRETGSSTLFGIVFFAHDYVVTFGRGTG